MAAFPDMLKTDRERRGFTVGQAGWRVGVKPAEHRFNSQLVVNADGTGSREQVDDVVVDGWIQG